MSHHDFGREAHEEQRLRAQRDDAVDTVLELAPLRAAAIRLYKATVEPKPDRGATYRTAWKDFLRVVGGHIEEYGEDPL
jgi:hypothetical protein